MALADIPGYGAYIQRRQMNDQKPLAELQQVQAVQGLLANLQKQQQEQAFRAGFRPDMTDEELIAHAAPFVGPEKLLDIKQKAKDRAATIASTEATKAAQLERQREADRARAEQATRHAEMIHEFKMSRAATDAERVAETGRHNKVMEGLQRQLAQIRSTQSALPKPTPGFRYKADNSGELEPIPGGPKDTAPKDLAKARGALQKADTVIEAVDTALKQTGRFTTGAVGAVLGNVPGTAAYDLDSTLDTIKANLGFAELQAMRDASPTGGALGQVAVQELTMLQSTLASLKRGQSKAQLERGLRSVQKHMENWKKAVADSTPNAAVPPGAPAPGGTPRVTSDAEYNALPSGTEFIDPEGKKRRKP